MCGSARLSSRRHMRQNRSISYATIIIYGCCVATQCCWCHSIRPEPLWALLTGAFFLSHISFRLLEKPFISCLPSSQFLHFNWWFYEVFKRETSSLWHTYPFHRCILVIQRITHRHKHMLHVSMWARCWWWKKVRHMIVACRRKHKAHISWRNLQPLSGDSMSSESNRKICSYKYIYIYISKQKDVVVGSI